MQKHPRNAQHPHKRQLMVSGSDYYRKRADVDRGLKKRDFPSVEQHDPSELDDEVAVGKNQVPKH
jgi:hypothetical protein